MNKFLINFQRTGAMFPVKASMMDSFWTGGPSATATTPTTQVSDENKQAAGGSPQIAIGMQNAQNKEEESKPINIWEEKKGEDGKPIVAEEPKPLFSDLTQEQIDQFSSQINVLSDEDEAMIKVIAGDDPEKQNAMRQLMTTVGRRAISQSVFSTSKAFGTGVSNELNAQDPKIARIVDEQVKQQALIEQFPMASNPQTAPIFQTIMKQTMKAMPATATRQELFAETQRQLDLISKSAGQRLESPDSASKKQAEVQNSWQNFFSEN